MILETFTFSSCGVSFTEKRWKQDAIRLVMQMSCTNDNCPRCQAPAYIGFLEVECVSRNCPNFNAKIHEEYEAEHKPSRAFPTVPTTDPVSKLKWPTANARSDETC